MTTRGSFRIPWTDLFGLGSLPGSDDEARHYLRRRVGLYFRVLFGIFAAIYGLVVLLQLGRGTFRPLLAPRRWVHFGITVTMLVAWQLTRSPKRTVKELAIIDAVGTTAVSIGVGLFCYLLPDALMSLEDVVYLVLVLTQTFLVRAVIVPSGAARTLFLSFTGMLPLAAGMYRVAAMMEPSTGVPVSLRIFEPLTWLVISMLLTGLTSRVIYGLRRKVEQFARLGQYTLGEKLGEGGMGIVYRASHAMLRRPTALKLLPPDRAGASAVTRFEREVQLTATLTHPNIVTIYDFGRTPDGVFYYVMEHLDGLDLEALVRADGPQPAGRVVHILKQVVSALAEAHGAGLIHRDIKPANVVLCERGLARDFAKVVDFGLVRDLSRSTQDSTAGAVQGTPLYMAPEAIVAPDTVDGRSDYYALGAVAYYMLTGQPVFTAETLVELCAHHLHTQPPAPSTKGAGIASPKLDALVLSCLAKHPHERPQSATDFLSALDGLDDVAPWTVADAIAWWSGPGHRVRTKPPPAPTQDGLGSTIAVDLSDWRKRVPVPPPVQSKSRSRAIA
jgi:serine/threonine-protein kinase